jgi:hypothetical protein
MQKDMRYERNRRNFDGFTVLAPGDNPATVTDSPVFTI